MKNICQYCGQEFDTDGGLAEAMSLFERVHGRKANSAEEMESWIDSDKAQEQIKQSFLQ